MRWSQATNVGKMRPINEDCLMIRPEYGLFAVADGMGGHRAGEIASRLALQVLEQFLHSFLKNSQNIEILLREGIQEANRSIYQMSVDYPECRGMGTTLSCALIGDEHLYLAHAGDSRIYLLREGTITQLTEDHSLIQEMIRNGGLTEEQAACHPYRHVLTRALGIGPLLQVDTACQRLHSGDIILLCTDGLSGLLNDNDLCNIIYKTGTADLDQIIFSLINQALERGGNDNISAILVAID